MNKSGGGGGEDDGEVKGGEGEETVEGAGLEKEHHCLPFSLLCWSLSSFLMALDSLTIKRGMKNERGREEKRHSGRVNNSDTEAPLNVVDGVIFNKGCASEPWAVVNARLWLLLIEYC